jgi:hypothetical protein
VLKIPDDSTQHVSEDANTRCDDLTRIQEMLNASPGRQAKVRWDSLARSRGGL